MKISLILYNLIFPLLFLIYLPVFLTKLIRRGNFREGFWERFGIYSAAKKHSLGSLGHPIWLHAVSVGETVAALSLMNEWCKRDPDIRFVLSTTTSTGQMIARKNASEKIVPLYFPLDHIICVNRALLTINPRLLIIFEVEIWPTLIAAAHKKNVKSALINCRLSDNSAAGYKKYKFIFSDIFAKFCIQMK